MIYIDTGAFLARYIQRDQYHRRARAAWQQLRNASWHCYTSNFVLDETFSLLARRTSYPFAAQTARSLLTSDVLQILRPTHEIEIEAVQYFEKFADQEISFTDCISFPLIRQQRITRAFAFDRHFLFAGFQLWPE